MDPAILGVVYRGHRHAGNSLEALKFCWKQGAKYRPSELSTEALSAGARHDIKQEVERGLTAYVQRMIGKFPEHSQELEGWGRACIEALHRQVDRWPDDVSARDVGAARTTQVSPAFDQEAAAKFIADFHKRFVVTLVDKLGTALVAVCLKYFVEVVIKDLEESGFFTLLMESEEEILERVKSALEAKFGSYVLEERQRLAYASTLVKMHKNPISWRFYASCAAYQCKRVGAWLTALCRGFEDDVQTLWTNMIERGGLQGGGRDKVWFIKNSYPVVDMMCEFNQARVSVEDFRRAGGVTSMDCTRMYSNMPQDDLKEKLVWLLRRVWRLHFRPPANQAAMPFEDARVDYPEYLPVLKIFKNKGPKSVWYRSMQDAQAANQGSLKGAGPEGEDKRKGDYLLFSLALAEEMVEFLIDNAYVRGFDMIFRQSGGMPIGVSPGVYFANFYLFVYELLFLTQLVGIIVENEPIQGLRDEVGLEYLRPEVYGQADQAQIKHLKGHLARWVWKCWKFTLRYVDDMESVANPLAKKLLYLDQSIGGGLICGAYPRSCPWEPAGNQDLHKVPFMEVLQMYKEGSDGVMAGTTHLYDKRREPTFQGIDYVQYTHATTGLSKACLYNILVGQVCRFSRVIMDKRNFAVEVATLLEKLRAQGYRLPPLLQRYKRYLKHRPHLYGGVGWGWLWAETVSVLGPGP